MGLFTEGKLFRKAGEGSGGGGGGDQHNLGWYATSSDLQTAHPTASAGDWAIVGATDTVWIWDTDNSEWVDSGSGGGNFVPAVSYTNVLYGTTITGQQTQINYTISSAGNTIVLRDGQGRIQVGTPSIDTDAATKKYVDDSIADVGGLPDQTGNSGKFLTTDGTDASWGTISALQNTATGNNSLTILGTPSTYAATVNIGKDTSTMANLTTVVGAFSSASGQKAITIGSNSMANGTKGVSIGYKTRANANNAIQIGNYNDADTINSDANTFKVANANGNFEIMSADGTIPEARLADTTSAAQGQVLTLDANLNAVWQAGGSGGGLPSQTGNAGKFLTTDGTDASWGDAVVNNSTSGVNRFAIGSSASANQNAATACGASAVASSNSTCAYGSGSYASGNYSIAIGKDAATSALRAIQLGYSANNSDANTFKVANANGNFEIMSADGTIPAARHASLPSADGTYVLKLVISGGVPTLSWVAE